MSSNPTFLWKRSANKLRQSEIWLEYFCVISLFFAASILFAINLGNLALTDWNEGIVAEVAKEIAQAGDGSWRWIFPTLWGKPYLEYPPLVHDLIAIAYSLGGVSELTTRLPGALLGATSVLLVYNIGREIFVARIPALFSALIYLTCLPVVRLGRLAMLDGPFLCFEILTIWAILRSRRDLRWALVAGMGMGMVGLSKGLLGLPIVVIALLFLLWDTPRLISSIYLWAGISLGTVPLLAWYVAQWLHYQNIFSTSEIIELFSAAISSTELVTKQSPWYYWSLLLQYFLPWIVVIISGLKLANQNLHWSWAKLVAIWGGVYLSIILISLTYQPLYILPIFPALALAGGAKLDRIRNLPSYVNYPRTWALSFGLMAIMIAAMGIYFALSYHVDLFLPLIFTSLTLTLGATVFFLLRREQQFISLLFWGLYISWFFLFSSSHWIWELNSLYPVKPIAALIQNNVAPDEIVYTSFADKRPSLNFYSNRQVIPQDFEELKNYWHKHSVAYLLIDRDTVNRLELTDSEIIKDPETKLLNWFLAVKNTQISAKVMPQSLPIDS